MFRTRRFKVNVNSTFLVSVLVFPVAAFAGADPGLVKQCNAGDAKSCAYVGANLFKTNEQLAKKYYQRACDRGHTASCVFTSDLTVGNIGKLKPKDGDQNSKEPGDEELKARARKWYNTSFRYFLESVVMASEDGSAKGRFTVVGCERPHEHLREDDVPPDTVWKFGDRCDLEGRSKNSKTEHGTLGESDFRMRNMEDAARVVLKLEISVQPVTGSETQKFAVYSIRDGTVFDASGGVIAKFTARITKYQDWNRKKFAIVVTNPTGTVQILEYRGRVINLPIPMDLSHMAVEGQFKH